MIKFFRNIRHKWINEGRGSRYLLYAIGEIFLVVLGILIALQVNNWNEKRKEKKQEEIYLKQLQTEFRKDSTGLADFKMLAAGKVTQADFIIEYLKHQPESVDTVEFIKNAFLIGRSVVFQPFLPTYDELISSGRFSILQNNDLTDLIRSYVDRMEGLNRFSFQEGKDRKETYNTHLFNYFSAEIMPVLWQNISDKDEFLGAIASFSNNINGFAYDPQSLILTQNIKAADMEAVFLYQQSMDRYIIPILSIINDELDN